MTPTLVLGIRKLCEEDMMHFEERKHVWGLAPYDFNVNGPGWPESSRTWTIIKRPHFVCTGGHNGKGCGATMGVSDAAVALTARQNCAIELARVKSNYDMLEEESRGYFMDARKAERERDEARAVAGELFGYLRADVNDGHAVAAAYMRIRPSVRRMLEESP